MEQKMTDEEKGYHCPNIKFCEGCEYKKTICIVFSFTGRQKYIDWLIKKRRETAAKK